MHGISEPDVQRYLILEEILSFDTLPDDEIGMNWSLKTIVAEKA